MSSERGHDPGPGLGEWVDALRREGFSDAANRVGGQLGGTKEEILTLLELAHLPVEPHLTIETGDFLAAPDSFFAQLPEFNTYFAVFQPGIERLVGATQAEVVAYVDDIAKTHPEYHAFYLSGHDFVMGAGITVDDTGSVNGRFVLGQYNELSSGRRQPDLVVTKPPIGQLEYAFTGIMSGVGDWQVDETLYPLETGREITAQQVVALARRAIFALPRNGSTIQTGWYELKVLEHANAAGQRGIYPYFIKAVY